MTILAQYLLTCIRHLLLGKFSLGYRTVIYSLYILKKKHHPGSSTRSPGLPLTCGNPIQVLSVFSITEWSIPHSGLITVVFISLVCMCICVRSHAEVKDRLATVVSFLPPRGSWPGIELNSSGLAARIFI